MKIIRYKTRRFCFIIIIFCLLICIILNIIGCVFNCKYISVMEAVNQADNYEVRSRLLMEAMDQVGACEPEDTARIWANGLKERSAALQYSVLDSYLKAEYARQLEITAPNWVTGISSPWVESYSILKTESPGKDSRIIEIMFYTATSSGPYENYKAVLNIECEENFWRITKLSLDAGLYPYTGFTP